jgi:redox-sensing transcriptional repressor
MRRWLIVEGKNISQAVVSRLPRYYRYLGDLKDSGIERVSSQDLSKLMNVTASQIRQDFNNFGGFGQQGYGYNVEYLYNEIAKILGLNEKHNLIIVGAGNLGRALANYMNFERRGFIVRGIFDRDENLYGTQIRDIPVQPMENIEGFVKDNNIDIAVLTIPKDGAVKTAEILVKCKIKAIWNFAHVDLKVPDDVVVENVHLSDSLMKLSYGIAN